MTSDVSNNLPNNATSGVQQPGVNGSIWVGVLLILLGVAAIAFPNFSTLATEIWVAWIVIFGGVGKLTYAIQSRQEEGFIWKLLLGALYVATGLFLLVYPLQGILTLTILLGVFLLTEGAFEAVLAFRVRPAKNWGWLLANAITTILLSGLIWSAWPFNGPFAIGLLMGISLLFSGFSRLMLGLAARSQNNQIGGTQLPQT
jgi:uncharacterized membrane protein HdeD (DUF308 family)